MQLKGQIKQVRFYSPDNFFIVALIRAEELNKDILISGHMRHYDVDLKYQFVGEFVVHPKYGQQFKIESYEVILDNDSNALITYLSSSLFNGVGMVLAKNIVDMIGENVIDLIKEDKTILDQVKGITLEKRDMIYDVLHQNQDEQALLQYFMLHHINLKIALRIVDFYKESTKEIIEEDPYKIINDIDGIGFKVIDKFALSIGLKSSDSRRIKAILLFLLKQLCFQSGSTYLLSENLYQSFNKTTDNNHLSFNQSLNELILDGLIVLEENRVYPETLHQSELTVANELKRFINQDYETDFDFEDVENAIFELQEKWDIEYDEHQIDAIYSFLENDIMILTGGPGTGKSATRF